MDRNRFAGKSVHNVLASGKDPVRMGSAHLAVIQGFQARDGWFVIAVGNDDQWAKLVTSLSLEDVTSDDGPNPGESQPVMKSSHY